MGLSVITIYDIRATRGRRGLIFASLVEPATVQAPDAVWAWLTASPQASGPIRPRMFMHIITAFFVGRNMWPANSHTRHALASKLGSSIA